MKKFTTLLLFCLYVFPAFAQEDIAMERMYMAERNAAKSLMNFKASPNTGNYDVTHYKMEFSVDPTEHYIEGVVSATFTAKENMNSITFDLGSNMTVNQVTMNGNNLNFTLKASDELVVEFTTTIPANQSAMVVIDYEGDPAEYGFDSFAVDTHNGAPVLWTLSEPYGAKAWWPCKQALIDKADSIDVYISAPSQYVSVSNGIIEGETTTGTYTTTHWDHDYPIPAYLVAIAVSNYEKYTRMAGSGDNTFPIDNYVYPEYYDYLFNKTAVTVDIMNFFETKFGPYPYNDEKYGHCQFGWGGGMEHATISFMGAYSRGIIAHELGHQWFGDKVTCGSWQDIWLNEGFAGYTEGLIVEDFDGQDAFNNWKEDKIAYITSQPGGSVYIPAEDTLNVNRVFSSRLTYGKGAMVLHMLRKKMGSDNFFQALQNYLTDPDLAYGYAKTPDLKRHLEALYAEDLDGFFRDWVYNEGYPSYHIKWHQNANNDVVLTFDQTQSHASVEFFEAPVNILFVGINNEQKEVVFENTANGQVFTENVSFEVNYIQIDPHSDLISRNNTAVLGAENFEILNKIVMYPNPVKAKLFVTKPAGLEITGYQIYNILGEIVQEAASFEAGFIPTAKLERGVYFISLNTSKGKFTQQILKK